ncbi:MAG: hypothetical protein V2B20_15995 [Pseudomonadota bacterium]
MKKIVLLLFILAFTPSVSMAGTDFVLSVHPGSLLISPDVDGFTASNGYYSEEISGVGSWIPSINGGVGFDLPSMYIDLTVGTGYLVNGAFTGPFYQGDVALRFKLGQVITLGPHLSLIRYDLSWDGSENVELSPTTGVAPGLCLTAGGKKVAFSMNLDYVNASVDAESQDRNVRLSSDSIDLSGIALSLGVIFRF